MADQRPITGWFYKNGKRIPIRAKKSTEKDLASADYNGQKVSKGSTIGIPGGTGTVERLYETSNPELLYKNRMSVRNNKTNEVSDFAFGSDINPSFGKKTRREPDKGLLRKNVKEKGKSLKRGRSYLEESQRKERLKLMKERGATSWNDVPLYLKQSTGRQTPGSSEMKYGTKTSTRKKGVRGSVKRGK